MLICSNPFVNPTAYSTLLLNDASIGDQLQQLIQSITREINKTRF